MATSELLTIVRDLKALYALMVRTDANVETLLTTYGLIEKYTHKLANVGE